MTENTEKLESLDYVPEGESSSKNQEQKAKIRQRLLDYKYYLDAYLKSPAVGINPLDSLIEPVPEGASIRFEEGEGCAEIGINPWNEFVWIGARGWDLVTKDWRLKPEFKICDKCDKEINTDLEGVIIDDGRLLCMECQGDESEAKPNKILNKRLQTFLTRQFRKRYLMPRALDGQMLRFNGKDNDHPGVDPWSEWVYSAKGHQWYIHRIDWRVELTAITAKGAEIHAEPTITITTLHAHSLTALVEHWKKMIDCLGQANCELSKEYCDEMLEDLKG